MKLARESFDDVVPKLLEDAGAYLNAKLVTEVLNGATGTTYPKPYPQAVADGATGFVGVITSNLRRSMGVEKLDEFVVRVGQVNAALAPYMEDVLSWSKQKYGLNFYEIAVTLYGPVVTQELVRVLVAIAKATNEGRRAVYSNQFPG